VKQWNRYVERLPAFAATPPGYFRQTHPGTRFGVVLLNGDPVQPRIDRALHEAAETGERARRFPVRFTALKQGRRR
jgi:hypothetical protein